MSSLANIIGLTQSTCSCLGLDSNQNFDALNVSDSGLYLTDHDGGFPLMESVLAAIDCNTPDNALDIMLEARSSAIKQFTTDVSATIAPTRIQANLFRGTIARPLVKSVFQTPAGATSLGLEVVLPVRRGQSLIVKRVFSAFPTYADFTINVWSNDPTFEATTIDVTGGVDGAVREFVLPEPLALPQHSEAMASEGRIIYRFYYTPVTNPYGLELHCCGQKATYHGFFAANGFVNKDGSVTSENVETIGNYSTSPGFSLDAYQTCGVTDWLCETTELGGYQLQGLIAQAIRYRAAINLIHRVLGTNNINAYTLLGRDALYGKRNNYRKEYAGIVEWIAQNVPEGASDCLGCKKSIIEMATVPL